MENKSPYNKSILEYDVSPLIQAAAILAAVLLFIVGAKLIAMTGWVAIDAGTPWLVACSFTLLYIIFNSVLSLSAVDQNKYWVQSLISYVLVCVGGGVLAYVFSGAGMSEVGGYKVIYVVFTMGYILLLIITRSMRKIVNYAEKQDDRLRGEE